MIPARVLQQRGEQVSQPLALLVYEDADTSSITRIDSTLSGLIKRMRARKEFDGKSGSCTLIHPVGLKGGHLLLAGLGKRAELTPDRVRCAAAAAAKQARTARLGSVAILPPAHLDAHEAAEAAAEGALLSLYRFDRYKPKQDLPNLKGVAIVCEEAKRAAKMREGVRRATIVAGAVWLARDLQNTPAGDLGPKGLADAARSVAKEHKLTCTVWGRKQIEQKGMHGLLAVNRGSTREPTFVQLRYRAPGAKRHLCLVGKSITFDSGGLQIKPGDYMKDMHMDMSGGAVVIAAMQAIAQLKPKLNVTALLGCTDNLVANTPYMPGDIIKTMSGKTILIDHTDAEGRVTLADVLHFATTLKPDAIIDFATLTGACWVALGQHGSGVFGTDEELIRRLLTAGERTRDRLWRLPLWDEYSEDIKTPLADVSNIGEAGRFGGASTAAAFLREFVGETPWVHIDMSSAMLSKEKAYKPKGGTGEPLRALLAALGA